MHLIKPNWPAPANVVAYSTTRHGGVSLGPFASLNLGLHVSDCTEHVLSNRALLADGLGLTRQPLWLEQVHSVDIVKYDASDETADCPPAIADGSWTDLAERPCIVMTADCLPVLLTDYHGSFVAAVHAGWRGLCDGILQRAIQTAPTKPERILAWLGPAIGPDAFQVGSEVRDQFTEQDTSFKQAFVADNQGKWLADLYLLARLILAKQGVEQVFGGEHCTYSESNDFFSYRRDGITGRMASLIYLTK
ncbi:peptidoglycan editing factor PgeF [Motilimonas eburnea]|uniref:peptidoglycan editing factor PgeF n=1 Tax=Motilimonas eburnea TaxID=1737488 RepID=UPI001E343C3D|nr:peptidoglycan editing factor PgeF [Motilimonas eburnea]MCE2573605.1 peptidoglycan editing factor PgeF [Motilimonas eburnea]